MTPVPPSWVALRSLGGADIGCGGCQFVTIGNLVICPDNFLELDRRVRLALLAHESVHIAQWREMGWEKFIKIYFDQCARYGYLNAPLEEEAYVAGRRAHELIGPLPADGLKASRESVTSQPDSGANVAKPTQKDRVVQRAKEPDPQEDRNQRTPKR